MAGPLFEPHFEAKEQKITCITDYATGNEALESPFPKL